MRKSLMAASAVLPALLLASACSTGSPHGSDADGRSGASPAAVSTLAGHAPLTEQQLTKALVTDADVPGWVVQQSSASDGVQTTAPEEFNPDDLSAQDSDGGRSVLHADKPQCQPIADVASTRPAVHRMASVGATFAPAAAAGSKPTGGSGAVSAPQTMNQMLIASHAPGDAQRVMTALQTAVKTCTAFTGTGGDGTRTPFTVTPGPAVAVGDESITYVMTDTSDKKTGAALVTVVRTGDTITSYLSTRTKGGAGDVPLAVARKQDAKLRTALAARK